MQFNFTGGDKLFRLKGNLRYVKKVATRGAKKRITSQRIHIPLYIKEADTGVLKFWHDNVQKKYIDNLSGRADKGWNWPFIVNVKGAVSNKLGQEPTCFVVSIKNGAGNIHCGLVFVAKNYYALNDKNKKSCFIWYMATAPDEYYIARGLLKNDIPRLGNILIDVAITTGFNSLKKGLIGLRASPKGKDSLLRFYKKSCKLKRLSSNVSLRFPRINDGRYFYTDEPRALELSQSFDNLR